MVCTEGVPGKGFKIRLFCSAYHDYNLPHPHRKSSTKSGPAENSPRTGDISLQRTILRKKKKVFDFGLIRRILYRYLFRDGLSMNTATEEGLELQRKVEPMLSLYRVVIDLWLHQQYARMSELLYNRASQE